MDGTTIDATEAEKAAATAGFRGRHRIIAPLPRRARQRHDGGRLSRHVSDPQPGAGGCRLEATHSVPPEIRTCDRRPGKLNAVLQAVPTSSDYPFGLLRGRHHVIASSPRDGRQAARLDANRASIERTPSPSPATARHRMRHEKGFAGLGARSPSFLIFKN